MTHKGRNPIGELGKYIFATIVRNPGFQLVSNFSPMWVAALRLYVFATEKMPLMKLKINMN